jgi:cobalt-zinc-cadmium efflux system membrane fusion protein
MKEGLMRGWIRWAASHIPGLLTLLALAGVAVWGVRNDWRLPSFAALWGGAADKEDPPETVQVVPDPAPPTPVDPKFPADLLKLLRFPSADSVDKAGIKCEPAKVRPMAQCVTASAMLDYVPSRYVELHSPVLGRIWSVEKELGAPVKKGDVLALIDAAEVGTAKAEFLQALVQAGLKRDFAAGARQASQRGALPEPDLRAAEAALREAEVRLQTAEQRLLNLGLRVRQKDFEALSSEEAGRRLRLLGLPDAVVRRIDPEALTANLVPLSAPFDGEVVTHPHAAPGQVVGTTQAREGEALFVVADIRELHIELDVHVEDVHLLRLGQSVTFVPSAGGAPATGKLAHISPEVNARTRTVPAHAEVANPDGSLRPHTFGSGRVVIRDDPLAVVVRNEAVQSEGPFSFVLVRVADDTFQVRPVVPGLRDEQFTAVQGVRDGEDVVYVGGYALKSELFRERIAEGD